MDYLSQLLGTPNDSIRLFVEHVDQFQKGTLRGKDFPTTTALSSSHQGEEIVQKHVPPATEQLQPSRAPPRREIATPAVPPQPVRPSKGDPPSKAVANESSLRATAAAHHPSRTNTPKAKKTATTTNTTRTASTHKQQQQPRKSVPKRGKASVVCGCFGTQHKVLANCLWYVHDLRTYGGGLDTNVSDSEIYILPYLLTSLTHTHTHLLFAWIPGLIGIVFVYSPHNSCGRISCQREGYDFCPFCGILVEAPPTHGGGEAGSGSDAAWRHKERLLRFDRESVQRMVVMDDQTAAGNSMAWLTEGERSEAHERQAVQDRSLSQRPNIKLDILL